VNRKKLIEIARAAMGKQRTHPARETGYIFYHCLRSARLAMELLERIDAPLETSADVIFAAALFHDVGKCIEPHSETGALLVANLLGDEMKPNDLANTARIVREHNRRGHGEEHWTASQVVQDADLLDHFGTQGVWLCFHWSGQFDQTVAETLEFYDGRENRRHLVESRKSLNFKASRRIFDERIAFEREFFDRLAAESEKPA
jgi:uncharacterized protein